MAEPDSDDVPEAPPTPTNPEAAELPSKPEIAEARPEALKVTATQAATEILPGSERGTRRRRNVLTAVGAGVGVAVVSLGIATAVYVRKHNSEKPSVDNSNNNDTQNTGTSSPPETQAGTSSPPEKQAGASFSKEQASPPQPEPAAQPAPAKKSASYVIMDFEPDAFPLWAKLRVPLQDTVFARSYYYNLVVGGDNGLLAKLDSFPSPGFNIVALKGNGVGVQLTKEGDTPTLIEFRQDKNPKVTGPRNLSPEEIADVQRTAIMILNICRAITLNSEVGGLRDGDTARLKLAEANRFFNVKGDSSAGTVPPGLEGIAVAGMSYDRALQVLAPQEALHSRRGFRRVPVGHSEPR